MRYLLTLVCLFLFVPNLVHGQQASAKKAYPKDLKPNESFTAAEDSSFVVLTSSQYDKVLVKLLQLIKADSLIENHEVTRAKLDSLIALKDSTIIDYRTGYDRYRIKWEGVHEELEDEKVKVLKLRRWTVLSGIIGVGAGVLLGVVVF